MVIDASDGEIRILFTRCVPVRSLRREQRRKVKRSETMVVSSVVAVGDGGVWRCGTRAPLDELCSADGSNRGCLRQRRAKVGAKCNHSSALLAFTTAEGSVRCAVCGVQLQRRSARCGSKCVAAGCLRAGAGVLLERLPLTVTAAALRPRAAGLDWADTPSSLFCIQLLSARSGQASTTGALGACRHNSSSSQLSGNSGAAGPRASPVDPPKMSENNKKKVKEKKWQAGEAKQGVKRSSRLRIIPTHARHINPPTSFAPPPRLLMRRRRGGGGGGGGRLLLLLPCPDPHPNSNQKGPPPADRSREDRARRSDRPSGVPSGSGEVGMDTRVACVRARPARVCPYNPLSQRGSLSAEGYALVSCAPALPRLS